jgi:anti-sigma factor RsiW
MNRHLSSDEFTQWLAGQPTPEQERHLAECRDCAAELQRIHAPIALFRGSLHEWSMKREPPARPMSARIRPGIMWTRLAATAALLAVIIAIGVETNHWRAAGIAREDDALLEQVQADVSRSVPARMEPMYKLMSEESAQ